MTIPSYFPSRTSEFRKRSEKIVFAQRHGPLHRKMGVACGWGFPYRPITLCGAFTVPSTYFGPGVCIEISHWIQIFWGVIWGWMYVVITWQQVCRLDTAILAGCPHISPMRGGP